MSFPIKITNPEDILPGGSWTILPEDLKRITEQNEVLIHIRGRVISAALLVEQKLDDVIATLFVGVDLNRVNLFKEILLNKEFFTFMSKWRVFRDFTKRKILNIENEEIRKIILSSIKYVIETRDKFAHGDIIFSGTTPTLHFVQDGELNHIVLNEKYFAELDDTISKALWYLDDIHKFLRGEKQSNDVDIENKK